MSKASSVEGLVEVDTALAVLRRVNLLEESNSIAIDIGGSLAKLLYLQPYGSAKTSPRLVIDRVGGSAARGLSVHVPSLKGTLHFFAFETRNIEQLLSFMREQHWVGGESRGSSEHHNVRATGGGAFKYSDMFYDEIGVKLTRLDEMTCVVAGLNFLLTSVNQEVYAFKQPVHNSYTRTSQVPLSMEYARDFVTTSPNPFPYLLVNIGSGVSIVKVTGHGQFERVSGSSLGGGTFWGLARLLLNCQTFDEVIDLTRGADSSNVDMLVADIYGGSYASLGLDANVIAASFGKVTMRKDQQHVASLRAMWRRWLRAVRGTITLWVAFWLAVPFVGSILRVFGIQNRTAKTLANLSLASHFRPQDVALSLLRMVSYNIGQIAYLNARVHGLERIYFGGNFIRDHPYTIADISTAIQFWSDGKNQALFLRHDGYLGAIGAFIGACSSPIGIPDMAKRRRANGGADEATVDSESESDMSPKEPDSDSDTVHLTKQRSSLFASTNSTNGFSAELNRLATKQCRRDESDLAESSSPLGEVDIASAVTNRGAAQDSEQASRLYDPHVSLQSKRRRRRTKTDDIDCRSDNIVSAVGSQRESGNDIVQAMDAVDIEGNADGSVVYFDDVYHESYRQASQGEWKTVVRQRNRSSGLT